MAKPPFKPERPTGCQIMIEKFMKDGITSGRAIAMTLDHFNDQHWYDRDRYGDMQKEDRQLIEQLLIGYQKLHERVAELEARC